MTACVLLRLEGDTSTYLVDLHAKSVSLAETGSDTTLVSGQDIRGVEVAIASERREATATFPAFSD